MDVINLAIAKKIAGSGGGGADILNEKGIIKQQHLPEGYPYSNGEVKTFVNNPELVFSEDSGAFVGMDVITETPVGGIDYTIVWNGTEYKAPCQVYEEDGTTLGWIFGNIGVFTGTTTNNFPFAVLCLNEMAAEGMGAGIMVLPLDGSTSVSVTVTGFCGEIKKMDVNLLPTIENSICFKTIRRTGTDAKPFFQQNYSNTYILNAIASGKTVVMYNKVVDTTPYGVYQLYAWSATDAVFVRLHASTSGIEFEKITIYSDEQYRYEYVNAKFQ